MTRGLSRPAIMAGMLAAALFSIAAPPSRGAVPPAAQAAFDRGVMAARQQEWDVALQNLQAARVAAPDAAEIFYNLGLVESKIPGRELRAIAWLGAYLTASPGATNAAAVKTYIAQLDIKSQGDTLRMIRILAAEGDEIHPNSADGFTAKVLKMEFARRAAHLFFRVGDSEDALKTADGFDNAIDKYSLLEEYARFQAESGDFAGARQTLATMRANAGTGHWTNDLNGQVYTGVDLAKLLEPDIDKTAQSVATAQAAPRRAPAATPALNVTDWTSYLDDATIYLYDRGDFSFHPCALDAPIFLDRAGYLKTISASGDPFKSWTMTEAATREVVSAQITLEQMVQRLKP
jgi:hypothetical protein